MSALRKGLAPLTIGFVLLVANAGLALADKGGTPNLGQSCDHASQQGLQSKAHQNCKPPTVDAIIDADGVLTPQSGDPAAREVVVGSPLSTFPTPNSNGSGLDMFDQDNNQAWTLGADGDDLHLEGGNADCPTAIRDSVHQTGFDCVVLDINGNLANGQQVSCDLEVAFSFTGMPCPPPGVKWHDTNGNGAYDSGEDIVLDVNNDGVFD